MKVAVLGCGPAGLMAAHGVVMGGGKAVIMSRKNKSQMFGAQYLHQPIPGVTERDNHVTVDYRLQGTVDAYRRKVYGPQWDGEVSPEDFTEPHSAWDIREAYDRLWVMYESNVLNLEVDAAGVRSLYDAGQFDLVINTIPLEALCVKGHTFGCSMITAAGDAPSLGIDIGSIYRCPPDTVMCNGEESPSWYRLSNIFGHTTVEWPASIEMVPIPSASKVKKPTFNNCDCWPEMLKLGRYGSWTKGVLSHTAYNGALEAVDHASVS